MNDELDPRWIGAFIQRAHWHFHSQLHARYGIVLAPGEYKMICRAIKEDKALLVEQRNGRQAIYSIRIPSAQERVYVLAAGENLITAWPPEKRLNRLRRQLTAERGRPRITDPELDDRA